eukprot:s3921_g2.t1
MQKSDDEDEPSSSAPAPNEPSSSATPVVEESFEISQLRLRIDGMSIEELNAVISDREHQLKIKKQLSLRKKEKKGEDITINLLQPSGRAIPHVVKPKNTILQVKRSIVEALNMDKPETIRLIHGMDEMRNTKTIAGYGIDDGDMVTIVMALAGGAKRGVVQQNFLKQAKRMQATNLIQQTQNTTDEAVGRCNHVSNQLMTLADTDARGAMRALLINNVDGKLNACIEVLKTTHNKDSRLEQCADILFEQITKPVRNHISELNGAIETTHCVFQMMMSDAFCPNGKWDWKGFEALIEDVKGNVTQYVSAMPVKDFRDGKGGGYNWHSKNKYARAMERMKSRHTTRRFYHPMEKSIEIGQRLGRRTEHPPPSLDWSRVVAQGGIVYFDGSPVSFDTYRFVGRYDGLK